MTNLSPATTLASLLYQLAFRLERQSDQILQEQLGIGFAQYKILRALELNPAAKQKVMASNLGQTEASVSRQVKLLRLRGMLVTRPNQKSKRERLNAVTNRGFRICEAADRLLQKQNDEFFVNIDPKAQGRAVLELNKVI